MMAKSPCEPFTLQTSIYHVFIHTVRLFLLSTKSPKSMSTGIHVIPKQFKSRKSLILYRRCPLPFICVNLNKKKPEIVYVRVYWCRYVYVFVCLVSLSFFCLFFCAFLFSFQIASNIEWIRSSHNTTDLNVFRSDKQICSRNRWFSQMGYWDRLDKKFAVWNVTLVCF